MKLATVVLVLVAIKSTSSSSSSTPPWSNSTWSSSTESSFPESSSTESSFPESSSTESSFSESSSTESDFPESSSAETSSTESSPTWSSPTWSSSTESSFTWYSSNWFRSFWSSSTESSSTWSSFTWSNPTWSSFPDSSSTDGYSRSPEWRPVTREEFRSSLVYAMASMMKPRRAHKMCSGGMYFCMETMKCIPIKCPKMKTTVDYMKEALVYEMKYLLDTDGGNRHTTGAMFSICPTGTVYCVSSDTCVSTSCMTKKLNKDGQCPPVEPLTSGKKCSSARLCVNDNEGCSGLQKCCENACGGSYCGVDFSSEVADDSQPNLCRITAYEASEDPEPISMNTGKVGSLFKEVDEADIPQTLKFNISSATKGCTWKKVVKEVEEEIEKASDKAQDEASVKTQVVRTWSAIKNQEQLDLETKIACIPDNITFHGIAKVNTTDEDGDTHTLVVIIFPTKVQPNITLNENASRVITLQEDVPAEIEFPVTVSNPIDLTTKDLDASDNCLIQSEFGTDTITRYYEKIAQLTEQGNSEMGISVSFVNELEKRVGKFSLKELEKDSGSISVGGASNSAGRNKNSGDDGKGSWELISVMDGTQGSKTLKFEPEKDYFGSFKLEVKGWSGSLPVRTKDLSENSIRFTVKIEAVNDAPFIPDSVLAEMAMGSLADSAWSTVKVPLNADDNQGIEVHEAVSSFFSDAENSLLGMCVIRAQESDLGWYEYKLAGSKTWVKIEIEDPNPGGKAFAAFNVKRIADDCGVTDLKDLRAELANADAGTLKERCSLYDHQCLLLPPDALVRYQPADEESFWSRKEATGYSFLAWDFEEDKDNKAGDRLSITLPFCQECIDTDYVLSQAYMTGNAMKVNCKGVISSSPLVDDVCGMCGGDGKSCVDCNGDKDGDAIYNKCNICVGGKTNRVETEGVDCNGGCDNSYRQFANLDDGCYPSDMNVQKFIRREFCDGVWNSGAKLDDCGVCTGGQTGKTFNEDMDACGVCNGNSDTCSSCYAESDGTKEEDDCGNCLQPKDPEFNKGCRKFDISPKSGNVDVSGELEVSGAGLDKFSLPECSITNDETSASTFLQVSDYSAKKGTFTLSYGAYEAAGTYTISCKFPEKGEDQPVSITATSKLTIYSFPTLSSITPSSADLDAIPSELTITGSGFQDTGSLYCFAECTITITKECMTLKVATFEATFVDSGKVICNIPDKLRKSAKISFTTQIGVALAKPTRGIKLPDDQLSFSLVGPAPTFDSAEFVGGCRVVLAFSDTITEVDSCSDALSSQTVAKLGDSPECSVGGKYLKIKLGKSSSLSPDDSIEIKENRLRQRGTDSSANHVSGSRVVAASNEKSVKFEKLECPSSIGSCDSYTVKAKFQGGGCAELTYVWDIELNSDSTDGAVLSNLQDMKDKFQLVTTNQLELTSDDMIAGHSYKISVHTTTLQGETSEQKSAIIERTVGDQPLQISLGGDIKDHDPSKPLAIGSQVSKSMCASLDLDGLAFGWEAESTADVDLSRFTRSKIRIPPGYMKGGSNYTIKVLAMVINDMSITAEASVTISTMSQDLVAKIARAPLITTGSDSKLVLDGSASYDPDRGDDENDSIYHIWTCERVEEDEEGNEELGPCLLSLTDTDGSTSFVSFSDYQDVVDAKSIIELPEFSLSTNTKYQFTLTYKKNDRSSATKEIAVEVKEGSPPKVSIDEIEGSHNPNKDLVIAGSVLSPLDFAVTWSCVEGEGYEVLDVQAFSNANGKRYGGNGRAVSVALVVAAEFLKPGATYKFELDATHFDNFAVAALEVTVNAAPQCTDVTNTGGTSGTALTDEFTAVMEGCDDDETDFPLTYRFYTVDVDNSDKVTYLTAESQLASEISTKLSAGVRKFGCQVCDINKACADYVSDTEITLSNSDFTTSNIDQILEDAGDDVALGGESPLISQVLDNVESMDDPTDEVKEMVVTLGDMLTSSTLSGINAQDDPDGGLDKLSYTTETTEQTKSVAGSSALSEGSQEQMKAKTAEVAEFKINPEQALADINDARRKKRSVTGYLINSVEISEGETILSAYLTALEGIAETDIISEDAVTFIELLESVWQGVCAGQVEGQDAEVGEMEMLTFRAYTAAFADLANTTLQAACENCTHLVEAAMFEIGQHMQDLYSEWNCTDENSCLGGCLATGQLSYDALTATSEAIQPLISTRYSDIIAVHLVNPVTYELVEVTDMLVPMKLTIPLTSDPDFTTYQYVCRNWDYDNVDWSEDGCEAAMLDNSTDAWAATCYCYTTGYFAVFEGEELALLSVPSTTEFLIIEETTTAANFLNDLSEDDVDSVTIVFSIDADSALLANYSEVKADILEWLMDTMYVEEDRIENLVLSKGSIVVEFDLMSVGEGDLNVLITRLEKQVTSSSSITLLGTTYTLIPDSFSVSINENVGTSPAVSESGGLKMGVIIGVVVGCTMLIVLVVVIAVVCLKKGSGANKIQDSPRESRTHLSHAELGTYQFQPSKINPAEEALYGPAPVPHVPDTVTKSTDAPIGSRPTTSNEKRTLTPVS